MSNTHDTMPRREEYRKSIDELRFSEKAKARMAASLAEAARAEQQAGPARAGRRPSPAPRRRRLPLAAAVAALALVLGLGGVAYATGSLVSVQRFVSHLFGGQEPKVEIVDKIGRPIGVAQSSGGVTVSADAIIGDKTSLAVVFSVAKDDGTPFEGIEALEIGLLPLGFSEDLDVDFPLLTQIAQGMGSTGSSYFFDADPTDNAIQLVETRSYEGSGELSLVGRTMTAHFRDLTLYGSGESVVIAPGEWKLTFPIDYEDSSITLPAGQSFKLEGFFEDDATDTHVQVGPVSATVDELSISPIALHVRYTAAQRVEWTSGESGRQSDHDAQLSDLLLSLPARITLADGSVIDLADYAGGSISADDDVAHCETSIFFDRILDLSEVESVTIGGTTIKL